MGSVLITSNVVVVLCSRKPSSETGGIVLEVDVASVRTRSSNGMKAGAVLGEGVEDELDWSTTLRRGLLLVLRTPLCLALRIFTGAGCIP